MAPIAESKFDYAAQDAVSDARVGDDRPIALVITTRPLPASAVQWLNDRYPDHRIIRLAINVVQELVHNGDARWSDLSVSNLIDLEALRRDFLGFMESWPAQSIGKHSSFNALFRDSDDHPLWWPAMVQNCVHSADLFIQMRSAWLVDRALRQVSPNLVALYTHDEQLASILASKLSAEHLEFDWIDGSSRPAASPWRGSFRFLTRSMRLLLKTARRQARAALKYVRRSIKSCLLRSGGTDSDGVDHRPKIVMSIDYPRHVTFDNGETTVWYWKRLVEELAKLRDAPRVRYWVQRLSPENPKQRPLTARDGGIDVCAPVTTVRSCVATIARQYRRLVRYYRLERCKVFRNSIRFCGADVAGLIVPHLRRSVNEAVLWESQVDTIEASLRAEGHVKVALVHVEMYPPGMMFIAACQRLGIPTVGVQHGAVHPMHMIYTPPPTQVSDGAVPSYFVAYGQYAQEVLSQQGSYPAERIWIGAGTRFDHLVHSPPDKRACRAMLGLPENKTVLLVTTQNQYWFPALIGDVIRAVSGRDDICVCVKVWIRDCNREVYRELAMQYPEADVRIFSDSYEELLGGCDAMMSAMSTTLLESTLLGKPSICVNYADEPEFYPYVEEGVSLRATDATSTRQAIESIVAFRPTPEWQQRRRQFVARHMGPNLHGAAGAVFANLLHEKFFCSRRNTSMISGENKAA